jgi:hypothetical protein
MNGWPHINGHAGDADVVSTVRSAGNGIAFVEHSAVVGWAPLMAVPMCGQTKSDSEKTKAGTEQ